MYLTTLTRIVRPHKASKQQPQTGRGRTQYTTDWFAQLIDLLGDRY